MPGGARYKVAEKPTRKLAVLLHADVVGSTSLVRADEALAFERIQDAFQRFAELIREHGGTAHEVRGDAIVAEFPTASEAVSASLQFQDANRSHNEKLDDGILPVVRIGIAMGEVAVIGGNITGEGIVLAQRLEQLSEPGGVCLQDAAYQTMPKRLPYEYKNLGKQTLKGFDEPVRVFAVAHRLHATTPVRTGTIQAQDNTASNRPSIAVLPFANLGGDPEQEYFSDGISEDLIIDLAKISDLFVVARNASFNYKGSEVIPDQVARDLGVGYVLEGSVRRHGSRLRITAKLVDISMGGHIWADRYDGELADVFDLQDEITKQIVSALELKLTKNEQDQVARRYTSNLDAYDCFLRGRAFQADATQSGNADARRMFEQAIDLDSSFAGAYAQLSYCHFRDWRYQWNDDPAVLDSALEAAQTAVVLDDLLPLAHVYLGWALLWNQRHEEAIVEGERAIELDPNFAEGHARLGEILNLSGRPEEGIELLKTAMRLDPHYPPIYLFFLGYGYYANGEYDMAIAALKSSIARNANHFSPHRTLAVIYSELGRREDARKEAAEMLRISPNTTLKGQLVTMPFKDRAILERYMDGLRKAGIPEG